MKLMQFFFFGSFKKMLSEIQSRKTEPWNYLFLILSKNTRLLRIVESVTFMVNVVLHFMFMNSLSSLKMQGTRKPLENHYNHSMKSEIVPHNIFLALASTGSHILITLDGCWLITLLYTFKWLSKAVSLCLVSVWTACGTSNFLQLW